MLNRKYGFQLSVFFPILFLGLEMYRQNVWQAVGLIHVRMGQNVSRNGVLINAYVPMSGLTPDIIVR